MTHDHTILIIGGGFAGAALAIRLLDQTDTKLRIVIAEPRPEIGRGVAYSTTETVHLVNGPASHFSLYDDDPEHLANWTRAHGTDGDWTPPEGDLMPVFIPRRVFGRYVIEELARATEAAAGRATVEHLRSRIVSLSPDSGTIIARAEDGRRIVADQAVLATGVFPFAKGSTGIPDHPRHVSNPWDPKALDRLTGARDVLLIGASLSMIDMVASLESRGFQGRYHVISRRGHLIEDRRDPGAEPDILDPENLPRSTRDLLAQVAAARRRVLARGDDWQMLTAGLRDHIRPLWDKASDAERRRFARHLRALWDVTLHLAAPPAFAAMAAARDQGRFGARAARLMGVEIEGDRLTATLRPRGSTRTETLTVDGIVDCRGHQEHDWRRIEAPLVKQLLAIGLVRPHATGFGIDATAQGEVIGRDGQPRDDLFAIGHPLRGVSWESSSINEQLTQATALSRVLLDRARWSGQEPCRVTG